MTTLDDVRAGWNAAAQADAMGHILTTGLEWDPDEFYANGQQEIDQVLGRLDELGLRGARREEALDFGCGVGRLSVALAEHYGTVTGVDISQEMIDRAKRHPWVDYVCADSLTWIPGGAVDLVYSNLVLQHMPQAIAHDYIRQFIRLLHADGLAVFEIPAGPDYGHPVPCLSMWGSEPEAVEATVHDAGGEIVDTELTCHHDTWRPLRYTARRAR